MESTNILLNRIFSKRTVLDLINEKSNSVYNAVVGKYLPGVESQDNRTVMQNIYQVINASYRNEYFYKNRLISSLSTSGLLSTKSRQKSTTPA